MKTVWCSVIVCTYNRLIFLEKCLNSLILQDYNTYEIIVVDDWSVNSLLDIIDRYRQKASVSISCVVHDKNSWPSEARNTWIRHASYDLLAFIDDDCCATKIRLSSMITWFKIAQKEKPRLWFAIWALNYVSEDYVWYFPERIVQNTWAQWPMTANILYHRDVFDSCWMFDKTYDVYHNEDTEMALRACSFWFDYVSLKEAWVYHQQDYRTSSSLVSSAKNASVRPLLKKNYPDFYLKFWPPIQSGILFDYRGYIVMLLWFIIVPLMFVRFLLVHSKQESKRVLILFFLKRPIFFFLQRRYLYKEAIKHKVLLF